MDYRREIDGLRAVSVISVVIYHADFVLGGMKQLPGGFVGVDVFFVISGFLITQLIAGELTARRFSILRFYERRARRILPALLFVILSSTPFALALMDPEAQQEFAGSVVSTLLFFSNFFFWFQDSYATEPSQLKPLLHTWSLSVEEQFYIFFPPLMMALSVLAFRIRLMLLLALALLSLLLAQYLSTRFVDANFFVTATRAWELICGGLLALIPASRKPRLGLLGRYLPTLGLGLILGAIITFSDTMPHPSFYTLIPVLGAVFVIGWANPNDPATRLLSSRPFVGIGLISYSFYLWHFPVFAFARISSTQDISAMVMIVLIILSGLMAAVTWRWVEQPFRNRNQISTSGLIYGCGGLSAVFLVVASSVALRDVEQVYRSIPVVRVGSRRW
ncbi:acyltransferase family protein [Rhodophyticola sp. CCM32]|uniref:acyltransferase family protein n=1 Tax=Rhodophyticola sp. CCM32 TaxID=2916397 RepID=UPI00143D04D7|nr:acyltransferase [Rhodophyticola sp. CCM32]